MEWFSRAIALDPHFAPACTGLADCFTSLAVWGFTPPAEAFARARELATRAVELDDTQAEGHATLGFIATLYDWDWDTARRRFERALALNPGHALTRLWYGHYLSIVGRMDEAIAEMRAAQDLDPLSPVVSANLGWTYILAHDCDRAIVELTRVLTYDAGNGLALFYLGYAFAEAGKYPEAVETLERAVAATAGMPWLAELLALAQGLAGRGAPARAALADANRRAQAGYVPPSAFALLHLALRDDDGVLRWLERGLAEHDAMMVWIKYMPCFDRLHAHPRFQALLAGLDLA
jgi:tetratricopeptide (TPR) repeat protein